MTASPGRRRGASPTCVQPGDVVMVETQLAAARRARGPPTEGQAGAGADRRDWRCARSRRCRARWCRSIRATGRVLAMVGGWSFEQSQFNRATQAKRQPGSSFKPIVYLTALEKGISPSQRFLDAPIVIDHGAQGSWRPGNYEMAISTARRRCASRWSNR